MTEGISIAVMLTAEDIETLIVALRTAPLPSQQFFGEAPAKENETMVRKMRHAYKALMKAQE